jgi:uncharacterized protein YcfJ
MSANAVPVELRSGILSTAAALLLTACATVSTGPSVMVLPGNGKNFEQFQADDAICRQWAAQQTGTTTKRASAESTVSGAAIGTAVGAAVGAAIGAAAGSPAVGAAVGAGGGLLGGTAIGASNAEGASTSVQHRYDIAYTQCMYAKGNQVPVASGPQPRFVPVSYAWADDAEKIALARVRLTTEAALTTGCTRLGLVSDDSIKDLRRKIVRAGGTAGVLSFGVDDLSTIHAEVFRCPPTDAPLSIPPPPAGTPPPAPPGPSR